MKFKFQITLKGEDVMLVNSKKVLFVFTVLLAISILFSGMAGAATQREYVVSLIKSAGMKDAMISTSSNDQYDRDVDALAKSLGFFNSWEYSPTANVTDQVKASMDIAMLGAYNGLLEALSKKPMEPYFVNGMAQPIFYYGNSHYFDTSGEGVVRFAVYVETDLDTDNDGKLDLVKVIVQ
jgi:X-Pro dipeptidyl-peptidase